MFDSQSGNSATEDCGWRNCCQNTKTRPHNLVHNLALGVSAAGMAFSNQEKPVMHTHTHTQASHIHTLHLTLAAWMSVLPGQTGFKEEAEPDGYN